MALTAIVLIICYSSNLEFRWQLYYDDIYQQFFRESQWEQNLGGFHENRIISKFMWSFILAQAIQSNWVEIGQTQLGDRVLVDENSFRLQTRNRSRSVKFNSRLMLASPESDGTIKITTSYTADCLRGTLIDGRATNYDRSNQIVSDRTIPVTVPVREGSVGARLYNYACAKLQN